MPKLKTRRAAAKRFSKMKNGGYKRRKAYKSHLLSCKSIKRKRNLRQETVVSSANMKATRRMVPFKGK
jgi:large subunit ribosomal protein L35